MIALVRTDRLHVNDYITTNSFKFQTLDDVTTLLRPNYYMAKIDLRHAYRSVPIHPDNYKATACKWQFLGDHSCTYFYDTRLPFGAPGGGGGGGYSHTLPIRVRAAQRGRDFESPDLEWGIHFRGVF